MDLRSCLEKGKQNPIGWMTTGPERAESQLAFSSSLHTFSRLLLLPVIVPQ